MLFGSSLKIRSILAKTSPKILTIVSIRNHIRLFRPNISIRDKQSQFQIRILLVIDLKLVIAF